MFSWVKIVQNMKRKIFSGISRNYFFSFSLSTQRDGDGGGMWSASNAKRRKKHLTTCDNNTS